MKEVSLTKNTVVLYVRIIAVTLVTLFSSRFIINSLGEVDYGIFNVIFGIVSMFLIISGAMIVTGNRFLISDMVINKENLNKTFSTLLFTHTALAIVFAAIIEIVGIYMIKYHLLIPLERYTIACYIFHISVISFVVNMLQIPFQSVLTANEDFDIQAYMEIALAVLLLIVAIVTPYLGGDRLFVYSVGYLITNIIIMFGYIGSCIYKYSYVSFSLRTNIADVIRIFSFASWNFLGSASMAVKMQGSNMLLNMFFGPIVNTSRGIAFQVNSALNKLSSTMVTAIGPRIIKYYDQEKTEKYNDLIILGSKYSYQIMFAFSLPIFLAAEFVLKMWLGRVPDYSASFVRLLIIYGLYDTMSLTFRTMAIASKNIKSYYSLISVVEIVSLIFTYVLLHLFLMPSVVFYMYIFTVLLLMFLKMFLLKKTANLSVFRFLKECFLPCTLTSVFHFVAIFLVFKNVTFTLVSFVSLSICSILLGLILTYFFVAKKEEKLLFNNYIVNKWVR